MAIRYGDYRPTYEGSEQYYDEATGTYRFRGEVDPETGEVIDYGAGEAGGIATRRGADRAQRKARRRTKRNRASELYQTRMAESHRRFGEARDDLDTAWDGAEDELPDYMDLLGGDADPTSNVGQDEAGRQAQLAALRQLQDIARQGYTGVERARMQQERRDAANLERQQRDAAMTRLAMRGLQGSGQATAAALSAQQGGANRMNEALMNEQAMATQRAMAALQGQAQLGGQMRSDSFRERSEADVFNFNNLGRMGGAAQQAWDNSSGLRQRKDDSAARRFQLHDAHTLQTFNMNAKNGDESHQTMLPTASVA